MHRAHTATRQLMKEAGITQGVQDPQHKKRTLGLCLEMLLDSDEEHEEHDEQGEHGHTEQRQKVRRRKTQKDVKDTKQLPSPADLTRARQVAKEHLDRHLVVARQGCTLATAKACVDYLNRVPVDVWLTLGHGNRRLMNRQLLLGERDSKRTVYADVLPPIFVQLFNEARASLVAEVTDSDVPLVPSTCTVNRYPVTDPSIGRGSQLGFHQDKGPWRELVVGVTLGPVDWRVMQFLHKPTKTKHKVRTEPCDVYMFRDALYSDWHHASMKKNRKQKETIYSVTYRWPKSECKGV